MKWEDKLRFVAETLQVNICLVGSNFNLPFPFLSHNVAHFYQNEKLLGPFTLLLLLLFASFASALLYQYMCKSHT